MIKQKLNLGTQKQISKAHKKINPVKKSSKAQKKVSNTLNLVKKNSKAQT